MTRADAITTARDEATRSGTSWVVFRLPLWPADCYGVMAVDRLLPMEAQTFECLQPAGESLTAVTTPAGDQGSLF